MTIYMSLRGETYFYLTFEFLTLEEEAQSSSNVLFDIAWSNASNHKFGG